jgi:NAD(P)-dependent dehydrogenase (short-subunit alcohol dehydrogenase family)
MPEALIWGASGGMGSALVRLLKANDWRIFAAARNETRIGPEADLTYRFDARAPHTIESIPVMIAPESDGLDLVAYTAGNLLAGTLDKLTPQEWLDVFDANTNGALWAARASLPLLKPGGHVFFIGAYINHLILPKMGAYAAAKAALEPMVSVLQKENRKQKFTLVRPGAVNTPFWANAPFSMPKDAKAPEVVAQAILARWQSGESGDLNL